MPRCPSSTCSSLQSEALPGLRCTFRLLLLHAVWLISNLSLQVGRDKAGAERLTMMDRSMWQSLLEICCHNGRIATALQVSIY